MTQLGNNYLGNLELIPSARYLYEALAGRLSREGVKQAGLDGLVERGADNRLLTLANRHMAQQRKQNAKVPTFKHRYGALTQLGTTLASAPDYDEY